MERTILSYLGKNDGFYEHQSSNCVINAGKNNYPWNQSDMHCEGCLSNLASEFFFKKVYFLLCLYAITHCVIRWEKIPKHHEQLK